MPTKPKPSDLCQVCHALPKYRGTDYCRVHQLPRCWCGVKLHAGETVCVRHKAVQWEKGEHTDG